MQVGEGLAGGHTQTVAYSFGGGPPEIHKAFVVIPDSLTASTPNGSRPVGDGVKLPIIVHDSFMRAAWIATIAVNRRRMCSLVRRN